MPPLLKINIGTPELASTVTDSLSLSSKVRTSPATKVSSPLTHTTLLITGAVVSAGPVGSSGLEVVEPSPAMAMSTEDRRSF